MRVLKEVFQFASAIYLFAIYASSALKGGDVIVTFKLLSSSPLEQKQKGVP